jgi:hypothetical protein
MLRMIARIAQVRPSGHTVALPGQRPDNRQHSIHVPPYGRCADWLYGIPAPGSARVIGAFASCLRRREVARIATRARCLISKQSADPSRIVRYLISTQYLEPAQRGETTSRIHCRRSQGCGPQKMSENGEKEGRPLQPTPGLITGCATEPHPTGEWCSASVRRECGPTHRC